MNKNINRVIVALVMAAAGNNVIAAEVPAQFDAKACRAEYPKASLMNEEEGAVAMSFLVSAEGRVVESKVEKTSGFKNLDNAAVKAITGCKFKPGSKDGNAAQTWTKVNYVWAL